MIFTIKQDVLLDALNIIQRGLPLKTPLPILNGIKVEVYEDYLILTSSNSDIAIQTIVSDDSLEIKATGKMVVPGKYLIDITRKIDGFVEMTLVERKVLMIKSDRIEYKLHIMDIEDYPDIIFLKTGII